jgi:hypothetical protein
VLTKPVGLVGEFDGEEDPPALVLAVPLVAELSAARRSKTVERILVEFEVDVRVVGEWVGVLGGEEVLPLEL